MSILTMIILAIAVAFVVGGSVAYYANKANK